MISGLTPERRLWRKKAPSPKVPGTFFWALFLMLSLPGLSLAQGNGPSGIFGFCDGLFKEEQKIFSLEKAPPFQSKTPQSPSAISSLPASEEKSHTFALTQSENPVSSSPSPDLLQASAPLQALSDGELQNITAGSIVNFTMDASQNLARMDLDMYLETHMEIEKFRAGYHNYNPETSLGWDQSWDKVRFYGGTLDEEKNPSDFFKAYGLTLVVEYEGTENSRKIARILLGSPQVSGKIDAQFNHFSGVIDQAVNAHLNESQDLNPYRVNLGQQTLTFSQANQGLFLGLTLSGDRPGFGVFAGKPLDGTGGILEAGRSDWWTQPAGSLSKDSAP
ncbi:hypothetical protein [Desulfobotulus sp.]|uniref:hypothetical protein n=1 Tax=Desulfobotulus sp. TaxID=1940337 RepID=UPI002A36EFDC|nr:hypothetical protein [Desulfobotulus sp.]MDY0161861.1 hypothetical protein [Desulfobotulus sp.]